LLRSRRQHRDHNLLSISIKNDECAVAHPRDGRSGVELKVGHSWRQVSWRYNGLADSAEIRLRDC
jgi:hypothetical protein